jgi:beta-lactamase class A
MTIGERCDAAVRYSDGTAANLLLDDIGGPAQFTAHLRSLGDSVSRLDQEEPELNRNAPGDQRDTGGYDAEPSDALIAGAATGVASALT